MAEREDEPQEISADSGAMSDDELAQLLAQHEAQAVGYYTSEIADEQAKALDYYYGRPFGDEVAGKSSVVDRTVAIVIDNAVAAVMKPFVSADDAVCFEPQGPEDEEAAEQATEYVNYIFNVDNGGFLVFHNWFKAALLEKIGVVKFWWEDSEKKVRERLEGLDSLTAEDLIADSDKEDSGVKIVGGPYIDGELYSFDIERDVSDGRVKIETVPSEEFLISALARDIETAPYVAHRPRNITRSDLIGMGFDPDVVEDLPAATPETAWDPRSQSRWEDETFTSTQGGLGVGNDKSLDLIGVIDEYVLADFDGDGIAERRRVIRVDDVILFNQEWDGVPFAVLCPVPMPNKIYGLSLADQTLDLQRISSVLWRQMLDNLYLSNEPAIELPSAAERMDGSTYDDLATPGPGRIIRTQNGGLLNPIAVPFFAKDAFPMLEYAEQQQEARTGVGRSGQGIDTNSLRRSGQMTATEVASIESGKNARVEMIARIFAETGVKRLFRGILKLVCQHQDQARVIRLRNKWVPMDPRGWNAEMDLVINVGLGVGSRNERLAEATDILATMAEVAVSPFSSLLDPEKVYNALKRKFNAAGIKNVEEYLVDPETVKQQPQQPDPEMLKMQAEQQAKQAELQMKQQAQEADMQMRQREGELKIQLAEQEAAAKLELERQKAEQEAGLAQQKFEFEAQMAERKMVLEAELAREQADRQHEVAMKQADAKISSNRPGGALDK